LLSTSEPKQHQAAPQVKRRANGTFAPGVSGNPQRHLQHVERQRLMRAKEADLLRAITDDAGGELSALDLAFAQQAAAQLAKAEYTSQSDLKVRLTRSAAMLVDRIRVSVASRRERKPVTAFDEYVAELRQQGKAK
jgi:hypothetical protein